MNATDKKYNGWTNYETWAVNLWIGNEQESYNYWCGAADNAWHGAGQERPDYFTQSEQARYSLCEALKEQFENESPLNDTATVYTDLLNAALSEVDWQEVANALLETVDGYEPVKD